MWALINTVMIVIGYVTVAAFVVVCGLVAASGLKDQGRARQGVHEDAVEAQRQLDACRETVKYVTQPAKSYREPATELLALVEAPTAPYVTVPARSADRWPTGGGHL